MFFGMAKLIRSYRYRGAHHRTPLILRLMGM